jgi:hypothetical protein
MQKKIITNVLEILRMKDKYLPIINPYIYSLICWVSKYSKNQFCYMSKVLKKYEPIKELAKGLSNFS